MHVLELNGGGIKVEVADFFFLERCMHRTIFFL